MKKLIMTSLFLLQVPFISASESNLEKRSFLQAAKDWTPFAVKVTVGAAGLTWIGQLTRSLVHLEKFVHDKENSGIEANNSIRAINGRLDALETNKNTVDEQLQNLVAQHQEIQALGGRVKKLEQQEPYDDKALQDRLSALNGIVTQWKKYDDTALADRVKKLEQQKPYDDKSIRDGLQTCETALAEFNKKNESELFQLKKQLGTYAQEIQSLADAKQSQGRAIQELKASWKLQDQQP